jgi:hypothetical protein
MLSIGMHRGGFSTGTRGWRGAKNAARWKSRDTGKRVSRYGFLQRRAAGADPLPPAFAILVHPGAT